MFSFIRYTIYLFIILLCLFFLQKWGVDVEGGVKASKDRIFLFAKSIYDTPAPKTSKIVDDIFKHGTSSNSLNSIKSYTDQINTPVLIDSNSVKQKISSGISTEGVLLYTNIERKKYGLNPLIQNKKLANSAVEKVDDMFALGYFEHESPSGKTAADLVRATGYVFQTVGENLALGDFNTDKKLVEAWMNSPSHRKNILNPKFSELGVAVGKGSYKGDLQWLAVQHFGHQLPTCPAIDTKLKNTVDTEKKSLEAEERELQKIAGDIESDPNQNKGVDFLNTYNQKVAAYNARLGTLRDLIKEYNDKIKTYNECLQEKI